MYHGRRLKSGAAAAGLLAAAILAASTPGQGAPPAGPAASATALPSTPPAGKPATEPAGKPAVTLEEAAVLIAIVRSHAMKEATPPDVPASLRAPSQMPLIATFYSYSAGRPVVNTVIGPSLSEAAEAAGDQLETFFSNARKVEEKLVRPPGVELTPEQIAKKVEQENRARWGVVQLDLVVGRKDLAERDRRRFIIEFDPGIQGLAYTSGGRTDYFTPIALFRSWGTLGAAPNADVVKTAYISQESIRPPPAEKSEQLQTLAFVEKWPGGPVLPLYRGNVLLPPPSPQEIEAALARAGRWFRDTQQTEGRDKGAFLPNYFPADECSEPTYGMSDHLRAAVALALLYHHTKDRRFADACDRALEYCYDPDFVNEDHQGRYWLSVDATDRAGRQIVEPNDLIRDEHKVVVLDKPKHNMIAAKEDIAPTALLLTALCYRALDDARPTADGRMKSLGVYLTGMVAPDGRLYASLSQVGGNSAGPFIANGVTYAEVLTALDLLERVLPTKERREAVARMADLLAALPADIRVLTDDIAMGRVAEALTAHYRVSRSEKNSEKYAQAVLKIADALIARQISPEKAPFADYAGGFAEGKLPPDVLGAAAGGCGLSAAYEMAVMLQRPAARFPAPVRSTARFLMNMQYRPENTFYLAHRDLLLGAFRRAPEDLGLHLGATAESVRALMAAFPVVAESAAPEKPPEKLPEESAPH